MNKLTIVDLITDSYTTAAQKGWHERDRTFPELIALMHSELSEALEEYRNGHSPVEVYYGAGGKPEGIPIELADVCIRIFDTCGHLGIDLENALRVKANWNRTRPYRHGGKVV